MPGDPVHVDEYLERHALRRPHDPAVACAEFTWTFEMLGREVDRCAAALTAHGIGPGDVVGVLGHSRPEWLVAFLACCRVGGLYLGLSPKYVARELEFILSDARPRIVLTLGDEMAGSRLAALDEFLAAGAEAPSRRPSRVTPDAPCAIVYTSGSTGLPKGALLSQRGIVQSAELTWRHWYGAARDLRTVAQHPINHVAWLVCECVAVLLGGGTLFFRERFDGGATLRLIAGERLNLWFAFPSMVALAMRSEDFATADLSSLRRIAFGSLPPLDLLRRLRARTAAVFAVSYGLTEASGGALTATSDEDDLETVSTSVGRVLPGLETRIVDASGHSVPAGAPGELLIRDGTTFLGYLNRPGATAETLDGDGWLHTGDAVAQDADGNLRLVGRLKEMFKSGGYNVYPTEVEQVIAAHDAVSAVAVVASPDPVWGEVGTAFVVLAAGAAADAEQVREHARSRLANYKVPKHFVTIDRLPQLPNGKPDKMLLRERAQQLVPDRS
ncbi:MAG: class I adenylate-forming enzyme family protein [Solirubrobacteraceae bacterium]